MSSSTHDIRFASAISDEEPVSEALDEALGAIADELGEGPVDLVVVFATEHHRDRFAEIAAEIRRVLNPAVVLGATAAGVLGSDAEVEQRAGLTILAGRLPGAWLKPFTYEDLDWPHTAEDLPALRRGILGPDDQQQKPAAILLFADPFSTPMVRLIPAINEAMPGVPVIGGLASGAGEPGGNRLLFNDRVLLAGAVGVAIGGAVRIDTTVSQGCRPIGEPWVITKARSNIIHELGRRPVLDVIQSTAHALPPQEQELLEGGILIGRVIDEYRDGFDRGDFLVRNIVGADPQSGVIAISDLVRVGQTVQFQVRDAQTAEEDLREHLVKQQQRGPAAGVLLCTCNGRGANLFEKPNTESGLIAELLNHAPTAGFFAAGEIGPIGGQNFLHGFTASLAIFRRA